MGVLLRKLFELQKWEAPDPGYWVQYGYAVEKVDPRGVGKSEGNIYQFGSQEVGMVQMLWTGWEHNPGALEKLGLVVIRTSQTKEAFPFVQIRQKDSTMWSYQHVTNRLLGRSLRLRYIPDI